MASAPSVCSVVCGNTSLAVFATSVAADTVSNELKQLLAQRGDINSKLYVVDMSKIDDSTIENGKGNLNNKDVYIVAEETLNVYYLKGYTYRSVKYFSY